MRVAVVVHNESVDERLVDETVTIPDTGRRYIDFTVELDELDGSATVQASIEMIGDERDGDRASHESVYGPSTGMLGFSGGIDRDRSIWLGERVQ